MDISSVIVQTHPEKMASVLKRIESSPLVEVHASTDQGKIVAVIEAPDADAAAEVYRSLWELPGVAGVHLAYHYFGTGEHGAERHP